MPVAGAVLGEHPADGEAEAAVAGAGYEEEEHRLGMGLIGQDGGEVDGGVVIDGDVQILVARPLWSA